MIIEYLNNELWENQWKAEIEVWFYKNIYSRKNFVVKFISLSNKFLLKHLATKTSDKNI